MEIKINEIVDVEKIKKVLKKNRRAAIVAAKKAELEKKISARAARKAAASAAIVNLEAKLKENEAVNALISLKQAFVKKYENQVFKRAEIEAVEAYSEVVKEVKAELREKKAAKMAQLSAVTPVEALGLFGTDPILNKFKKRSPETVAEWKMLNALTWFKREAKLKAAGAYKLKFVIKTNKSFLTCIAEDASSAVGWAMHKYKSAYVVDVFPVSKEEIALEKKMMHDSSSSAIQKGMTISKFIQKYPELVDSKAYFAVMKGGYYQRTICSTSRNKAKHIGAVEVMYDPLEKYMARFDLYFGENRTSFRNLLKKALKHPEMAELIIRCKKWDYKKVVALNKACGGNVPQYVVEAIEYCLCDVRVQKYTDNLGLTIQEKVCIAHEGVLQTLRNTRSFLHKVQLPDTALKNLYKLEKNEFDVYPYAKLAIIEGKFVKLSDADLAKLKYFWNKENMFLEKIMYGGAGEQVRYNYAGLIAHHEMIGKRIANLSMKDFPKILQALFDAELVGGNGNVPIKAGWENIQLLDTDEKIDAAVGKLHNCMRTYKSAVASGRSFLFFVELEEEIAGFEISGGKLIQLYGPYNCRVSEKMRLHVDAFIADNTELIEYTINAFDKSFEKKKSVPVLFRDDEIDW